MRNEVMWAIRDSKSLDALQKVFLYTVESRGDSCFATSHVNAADMGLSRATYYRIRDELLAKGIIEAKIRGNASTIYTVNPVSLSETLVSQPETLRMDSESHLETAESHTETPVSPYETPVSHSDNYKKNIKEEPKEELEEESPVDKTKDSQTDDSLFVGIQEDAQIIKHDAEPSFVENKTKHFFVKVVGGPELSSKTITEAVAKYKADHEALGVWSEGSEESYPLALEKALDPNWKPGLFDLDRRVDRAFIEASHEKWREPEVVPVAVGDDW